MKTWISNLKFAAFLVAVPAISSDAFSQGPQCAAPQCAAPQCAAPYGTNCCGPSSSVKQSEPFTPPGMFVAPPPAGDVFGESNGLGFHGPALHIPQSTIRLPSLQFGSAFRSRRGPEMITDQSRATFQSQPALKMQLARPNNGSSSKQSEPFTPPNCTVPAPPCSVQNGEIIQLQQQVAQLTALVGQLAAIQQAQNSQVPVAQVSPIQPAGYYQPTLMRPVQQPVAPAGPSVAEQQMLEQYDQKCRELAAMQEQLAATQWEYQALLEAKQQKIVQERDARMRRQLGEQVAYATEQPVPSKSNSATLTAPQRTRVVESTDDSSAREPLRLRGQARPLDNRALIQEAPTESTPALEDREEVAEEAAPAGSKFGRWLKRTK
ncbi:MAG: hypothetical protein JSS49_10190 [Planctomycetes bacterium]|nr:hypothetical protein [Planctomycetota bacterium]